MLSGKRPVIYGDGRQSRDFTYVENVVEANLLALAAPSATGQVCNIGCGERKPAESVYVTWRPVAGGDSVAVAVEAMPKDWVPREK